jgi:hypothetical protein
MSWVAAAVGGGMIAGGTVGSIIAGNSQADAMQKMAEEQQRRADMAMGFSVPTAQELETLNKQIAQYDMFYGQAKAGMDKLGEQIRSTYGENIMEQGKQLHAQLTGGQSQTGIAARELRSRQRKQLEAQIVSQMGPGGLTSSAGQQMLQNFDFQTDQYLTQVDTKAIGDLITGLTALQGGQSSAAGSLSGLNSQLMGALNQIQGTQNTFQTRQMSAALGTAPYQGSQYVGDLQNAKNAQQMFGQIAGLGGQIAGIGLSSGLKGSGGGGGLGQGSNQGFSAPNQGPITGTNYNQDANSFWGVGNGGFQKQGNGIGTFGDLGGEVP